MAAMKADGNRALKAYVLPFVVFMLLLGIPSLMKVENSALAWWRFMPELWVYPLQILVCGMILFRYRMEYQFRAISWRVGLVAVCCGVGGIVLWILPAHGFRVWGWGTGEAPELAIPLLHPEAMSIFGYLGMAAREGGFDPEFLRENSVWYALAIGMRFLRMVVLVPLVEEIFWRGFLMRYFYNEDRAFWRNPFGGHRWRSYGLVTVLVMLAHSPLDWLGAVVFGTMMYGLAVRTKSLTACVLTHAVANLLLGMYVVQTQEWGFW